MGKVRIRNHTFNTIEPTKLVHFPLHETLLYLGSPYESNDMTICFGIGRVITVQKGQEFDMVGLDFGRGFPKEIIVKNNHARRQIYTLKKGQYCWFYGLARFYKDEKRKPKVAYYAKAFQGWYVPKNFDIKQLDPNEIEKLTEENESKINFIDDLLKGED